MADNVLNNCRSRVSLNKPDHDAFLYRALLVRQLQQQRDAQDKEPTMHPTDAAFVGWIVLMPLTPTSFHQKKKRQQREMWDLVKLDHFIRSATKYNGPVILSKGKPSSGRSAKMHSNTTSVDPMPRVSQRSVLSSYARSEDETAPPNGPKRWWHCSVGMCFANVDGPGAGPWSRSQPFSIAGPSQSGTTQCGRILPRRRR